MAKSRMDAVAKSTIDPDALVYPEDIGLTVKGFGSMKDIMNLDACDIDLTKPIYEQVYDEHGQLRATGNKSAPKAA